MYFTVFKFVSIKVLLYYMYMYMYMYMSLYPVMLKYSFCTICLYFKNLFHFYHDNSLIPFAFLISHSRYFIINPKTFISYLFHICYIFFLSQISYQSLIVWSIAGVVVPRQLVSGQLVNGWLVGGFKKTRKIRSFQ